MVRIIAGTLLRVGSGQMEPEEILRMDWLAEMWKAISRPLTTSLRSEAAGAPPGNLQGDTGVKILAISDVESKYLWDYFEKSKLEGSILSYHVGILIPAIFLFWRHLHQRLFYMSMETMTINMKGFHRKAASALTIKYMCMKEYASWDLAVPCDINRENINIQSGK